MELNWVSVITIFLIFGVLVSGFGTKLKIISTSSFIGTYVVSGNTILGILPGALVSVTFVVMLSILNLNGFRVRLHKFRYKCIFFSFIVYSLIITIFSNLFFSNKIYVIQPNAVERGVRGAIPLTYTTSTLAQLSYLIFAAIIFYVSIGYSRQNQGFLKKFTRYQFAMAFTFSFIVLFEIIFGYIGIAVKIYDFLMGPTFTEPRIDRYNLEDTLSFSFGRAQSVFGEPSFFAAYLIGIWGGMVLTLRLKIIDIRDWLFSLFVLIALLLTFSTTAIIGLFIVTIISLMIRNNERGVISKIEVGTYRDLKIIPTRNSYIWQMLLAFFIVIIFYLYTSDDIFNYYFGKLLDTSDYELGNYSSGAERLYWDMTALSCFIDSYGLGIGAGGTRASSFLVNFVAAYGIPGLFLIISMMYYLVNSLLSVKGSLFSDDQKILAMTCTGWLVGFSISVPDGVTFYYLWISYGVLLGSDEKLFISK